MSIDGQDRCSTLLLLESSSLTRISQISQLIRVKETPLLGKTLCPLIAEEQHTDGDPSLSLRMTKSGFLS